MATVNKMHDYAVSLRKIEEDGNVIFEARVRELPDLREYGDTPGEAYDLLVDAIETTAQIFAEKGKEMPRAIEEVTEFSGRVTLRLGKSLHKRIAEIADRDQISLNQCLVNATVHFIGFSDGSSWRTVQNRRLHFQAPLKGSAPVHNNFTIGVPRASPYALIPSAMQTPVHEDVMTYDQKYLCRN